jgi:hypothetical protein
VDFHEIVGHLAEELGRDRAIVEEKAAAAGGMELTAHKEGLGWLF